MTWQMRNSRTSKARYKKKCSRKVGTGRMQIRRYYSHGIESRHPTDHKNPSSFGNNGQIKLAQMQYVFT
jgi:hypothetical protein